LKSTRKNTLNDKNCSKKFLTSGANSGKITPVTHGDVYQAMKRTEEPVRFFYLGPTKNVASRIFKAEIMDKDVLSGCGGAAGGRFFYLY
jgi:hypothetical protein